jgi:hypothetical protein
MTLSQAVAAWYALRDVPLDETPDGANILAESFMGFVVGTDIEDVWHFLESSCPEFSAGDAMQGKYA